MEAPEPAPSGPGSGLRRLLGRLLPGRSLVELEALGPDLANGLRAAVATVVPVALSVHLGRPELRWMALGGWLGTLADPGGSRGARARTLAAFAVLGSLDVLITAGGARTALGAVALVASVAFFATMLRALGAAASTMGTMLTIVAAVGAGGHSSAPLRDALWFGAGGCSALILSSILWPIWTHLPVRRAVAAVYRELASYARAIDACVASGASADKAADEAADEARWSLLGRLHARRVREAIEVAREISLAVHARRSGEGRVGSSLRMLLGMAQSQFLLLVTVSSELEASLAPAQPLRPAQPEDPPGALAAVASRYDDLHDILIARVWGPRVFAPLVPSGNVSAGTIATLLLDLERDSEAARALAGALDDAEASAPVADGASAHATLAVDLTLFRDALSAHSPLLHHAFRVSVAAAAAVAIGTRVSPDHASWVTATTVVILQPHVGATLRRAAERVIGTVSGGAIAAAIAALKPAPLLLGAIMVPLSIAAVVTKPRSYRLFTFFLTPVFVLIAERAAGDWWAAAARVGDTFLGGAIALGATLLFFRSWEERVELPEALAAMEIAVNAYAEVVTTTLASRDEAVLEQVDAARLSAAGAIGRAEASLERLLDDPLHGQGEAKALSRITCARRLTLAATTLDTFAARKGVDGELAIEAALGRVHRYAELLQQAAAQGPA